MESKRFKVIDDETVYDSYNKNVMDLKECAYMLNIAENCIQGLMALSVALDKENKKLKGE